MEIKVELAMNGLQVYSFDKMGLLADRLQLFSELHYRFNFFPLL
uniref:Uncharacterized protein n=1 Tax=Rhizophora mucronata TaxID=61149 RepID=A0A2P2QI14_RHIMU